MQIWKRSLEHLANNMETIWAYYNNESTHLLKHDYLTNADLSPLVAPPLISGLRGVSSGI